MKPIVTTRMWDDKDFFVVDEDTTAEELVHALLHMRGGDVILHNLMTTLKGVHYENEKVDNH